MAAFGAGWKPALLTSEPETEALLPGPMKNCFCEPRLDTIFLPVARGATLASGGLVATSFSVWSRGNASVSGS
jgi:hypothetical protein